MTIARFVTRKFFARPFGAGPAVSTATRQRLLFALLCVAWGTTWLAMKLGTATVPPSFFSGLRWSAAGLIMLGVRAARGHRLRVPPRLLPRLLGVACLLIVCNATIQLYGLRHVSSGLAAVITSGLTPVALLGFSVALGQERFRPAQLLAIGLGIAGILLLFGAKALAGRFDTAELLGAAGIIVGCLCYSAGSVLARPLMRALSPIAVAAATNFAGGVILLALSLAFEPGVGAALRLDWGGVAWLAWLFLVFPAALGATTIYFILMRDWGVNRTGSYAFISPVIAVLLGVAAYGETVDGLEVVGMGLMLAAAWVVLRGR